MARWIGIFPLHGTGRFVVLTDVSHELSLQVRDGSEYAAGDDVAFDLTEPQLDLVQPRRVGGREVQVNLGVRRQEVLDRCALVGREVVGDHVDLFAARLVDHDVGEERDELGGGVPRRRFAEHLAGLRIEGGIQRQRTVTKVLKAVPFGPARPGDSGSTGSLRSSAWIAVFSSTQNTAGLYLDIANRSPYSTLL